MLVLMQSSSEIDFSSQLLKVLVDLQANGLIFRRVEQTMAAVYCWKSWNVKGWRVTHDKTSVLEIESFPHEVDFVPNLHFNRVFFVCELYQILPIFSST